MADVTYEFLKVFERLRKYNSFTVYCTLFIDSGPSEKESKRLFYC